MKGSLVPRSEGSESLGTRLSEWTFTRKSGLDAQSETFTVVHTLPHRTPAFLQRFHTSCKLVDSALVFH